ncbi:hypothetical protein CROQUDRAFT_136624 [Cronartium quercuum f. sp. fusiforme G11]|uniref:Uncharacterized protein n=1 Tax=Cronartium quercuum f. sp. fusiforme G11 TaxID=708437 RepID=A0A9P6NB23_9BASI|nr:hypothetical protein CROQUDRAFT_136624 [Cronartium quercuum f. sp. fusiforme G11]
MLQRKSKPSSLTITQAAKASIAFCNNWSTNNKTKCTRMKCIGTNHTPDDCFRKPGNEHLQKAWIIDQIKMGQWRGDMPKDLDTPSASAALKQSKPTIQKLEESFNCMMPSASYIYASCISSSKITLKDRLDNCLHIPDLKQSLIRGMILLRDGFITTRQGDRFIVAKEGVIAFEGQLTDQISLLHAMNDYAKLPGGEGMHQDKDDISFSNPPIITSVDDEPILPNASDEWITYQQDQPCQSARTQLMVDRYTPSSSHAYWHDPTAFTNEFEPSTYAFTATKIV